jgi:hypothetical protein
MAANADKELGNRSGQLPGRFFFGHFGRSMSKKSSWPNRQRKVFEAIVLRRFQSFAAEKLQKLSFFS